MTSVQKTNWHTCQHCDMEDIRMEDSEPTGHARLHWNHFDTRRLYPTFLLPLNHSPRDVKAAANTGCPFFVMLWEILRRRCKTHTSLERWVEGLAAEELCFEFQAAVLEQRSVSDSKSSNDNPLLPVRDSTSQEFYDIVACSVITKPFDEERWNHDFVAVSDWDDPSANHAIARLIDGHTSSSQAIGQIRRRLQYCLAYHDNCKAALSNIRPLRFILVPDSNDDKAKIVRTQNLDSNGDAEPYAALSYCWGHDQVYKLTSTNEADMEEGVLLSLLPKTITDAIRVTRELGIKLLWVDSLCLVQDKEDELAEEVAKMHHYYGNAHITISAATVASCSEGFLQDEPLPPRENGTRPIDGPFHLPVDLELQEGPSYLKFVTEEYLDEPQVIDTRAWTLQEGLLSQRLISFGSRIVGWFCRQDAFAIERGTKNIQPTLVEIRNRMGHIHDREYSVKKLFVWWEIVEDYSQRSMTDNRDKLPAISGIASVLSTDMPEREHQSGFMAGLLMHYSLAHPPSLEDGSEPVITYHPQDHFESWLVVVQMLWWPNEGTKQENLATAGQTQSSTYIAPSWSWAGHTGKVKALADMSLEKWIRKLTNRDFGEDYGLDLLSVPAWEQGLRVHEVRVTPVSSEAPLGALAGGSLTIEGHIFRPDEEQDKVDEIFFDDGRKNIPPGDSDCRGLYCLRLVPVYELEDPRYPLNEGMHGILLEPVDLEGQSRSDEKVYRRVGIYKANNPVHYDTERFSGRVEKIKII